jgi:hypothetical protein
MNIEETDSINGNDPSRQMIILMTHVLVIMSAFIGIIGFQFLLFVLSGNRSQGIEFIRSGNFIPIAFLLTALFGWWYLAKGFVNPFANRIQATDNQWSRSQFEDGSTQFIVYQSGFALKYFWERRQGRQVEVEMEKALECETISITIKRIALQIKLRGMYRVWTPRLSAFLQNIENDSVVILKQLKADLNQTVEAYASQFQDTEHVRIHQQTIAQHALNSVQNKYRQYGINLIDIKFEKCDYSDDTQRELNKVLELNAMKDVAVGMDQAEAEAFRTVAAAAGKTGVKLNVNRYEANAEFMAAMEKMGPTGALLMGLNNQGGEK